MALKDTIQEFKEFAVKGNVIDRLLFEEPTLKKKVQTQHEMSFYKKQMRIALRNCGIIDPEDITEYIANKGYQALGKVLTSMTPEEVIKEIPEIDAIFGVNDYGNICGFIDQIFSEKNIACFSNFSLACRCVVGRGLAPAAEIVQIFGFSKENSILSPAAMSICFTN